MTLANWTKITFIAVFILMVGYFTYEHYFGEQPEPANLSFINAHHATTVLALNLHANDTVSQHQILNGENAVLVIENILSPDRQKHYFIQGNQVLALIDHNKDGRIDAHDPFFSRLYLLFFVTQNKKWTPTYVSVAKAGIRSIFLNRKNLAHVTKKETLDHIPGTTVMADGSVHLIHELKIYDAPAVKK